MIKLYSDSDFQNAKSRDQLPLLCKYCDKVFYKNKNEIQKILAGSILLSGDFCCKKCRSSSTIKKIETKCTNCNKTIYKTQSQLKDIINPFCSQSCAATYNNLHKTNGTRRSKLEIWIEKQLTLIYSNQILFNDKTAINSELDIYIPSLRLAFELNGIYHYEPIHGIDKFNQIQNNDNRKIITCANRDIELCIIDVSSLKYFKEQNAKKYLDIIIKIINQKLVLAK